MLTIQQIREEKERVVVGLQKKRIANAEQLLDEVLRCDAERRQIQKQHDDVLSESNRVAKSIGQLMQTGQKEEAEKAKAQAKQLKEEAQRLGEALREAERRLQQLLATIPNVPHESVPEGASAEDNEIVEQKGEIPVLPENALPHWELIVKYDIIDFETGSKVTGSGFPFYKGKGAKLQRALLNFFLDRAVEAGYTEVQPPVLVNEASAFGTGQLPDKDGQMYYIERDKLYVIPTAEVPITNMYRDMILNEDQLPIKHVGYTPCFRREAGTWGADVRGLNRLHQFDKVEIVQIRKPEESYEALEEMRRYVQSLLEALELPYRVVKLCGGDMSFTSALTYDMEVFAAGQKKWLEVSSVSNFESYQAARMMLRYRTENKKTELLHTLNGSALAFPRIVAALLENNQTPEGIRIPKALQPYTGFDIIN
ncbi:seryl-tRNA synthetase [Thermonema lapsum]|uniref:Serine--tRNA ligase n=1 Tax=Thermonema lapsum TaxID=28195 RepID=A0A846MUG7_9BACT|nr:serine--tRNA ligase [Thermonema lapsum]NIK74877.1 seryl-tRNA synthetase [Thermonema lapsum]